MEKTALSVILTVYNFNPYLKDCINSILNQTFKDFEFLIVDDGSSDCAKEILEDFQKKDDRIVLFKNPHRGASCARNFGIKKAKGEYLLILDSDDFYEEEMFSKMLKKAKEEDLDIVISNSKKINEKTKKISRFHSFDPKKTNSVFDFKGWAWDKIFKREFILKNDLKFQQLRSSNDLFFSYMALFLAQKIGVFEEEFILHRENLKNSLSSTRDISPFCFLKAMRKLYFELNKRNLYKKNEKEFLKWAREFSNWHIKTLKNFKNKIMAKKLVDRFFLNI